MTANAHSSPHTDLQPGFMVIQGNRLESLRQLLVQWTRQYPLKPLENELILVQSNGIAQWLKLALAADYRPHPSPTDQSLSGLGIAAALDVRLPGRFLWQAYRAVLGHDLPDSSPFDKAPLTWRLMRLLPELLDQAHFEPLKQFLEDDDSQRKRHQLAEQLADLLDQYQVYRSDWLADWSEGRDRLADPGQPESAWPAVPADQQWQPELWRRVMADIEHRHTGEDTRSRAQVHADFMSAARTLTPDNRPAALPRRITVFGISSLPQQTLDVLSALSGCTQVLLCVHNPCQHYWGDIIEGRHLFRQAYRRQAHKPGIEEPDLADALSLHLNAHPLLAAWGRQGRDYIRLLDQHDERQQYESLFDQQNLAVDLFERPATDHLLGQLQDDILNLRPLPETRETWPPVDPGQDQSVVFHCAHSPQREVDILHDQLRAAFDQDPTLRPRDILVMVPDIDVYAPHIRAVFGQISRQDERFIPFTLSDQGQRHQNPLVIALEALLQVDQTRFSVSDLLDLLDVPALRARFNLNEDQVEQLQHWIQGANIRWGLHAHHRESLGLGAAGEQNTWLFGLRRMLLGYASDTPWQSIEPYDEIGGLDAALVGPLSDLLHALDHHWQALTQPRKPAEWAMVVNQLRDDLFAPQTDQDTRVLSQLDDTLEAWLQACEQAGFDSPLPLTVVREALLSDLDQPGLTQRFMAGAVNFATLMPMRAIPFRRICLLGMNDGDYPRQVQKSDFDLMQPGDNRPTQARPGDRSRREDDRYLFLEALLSAREQLYISWVAHSIKDNSARPPSVLVGQLQDHLNTGWALAGPREQAPDNALTQTLTTHHPLQPFSLRYFTQDDIVENADRIFTYAREWQRAHVDSAPEEEPITATLPHWLPEGDLTLRQLSDFLRQPVNSFFQTRLGVWFRDPDAANEDEELFALDGLSRWQRQHQLLTRVQADIDQGHLTEDARLGEHLDNALKSLSRAGDLPLPPFDQGTGDDLLDPLSGPLGQYLALRQAFPVLVDAQAIELHQDGTILRDWLNDIRICESGERVRLVLQGSRLYQGKGYKWHHLVRQWPTHLAAQLTGPTRTRLLGPDTDLTLEPLPLEQARTLLHELMMLWKDGMQRPLPVACETGFATLTPDGKPATTYDGRFGQSGEAARNPALVRCWPDYASLSTEDDFELTQQRLYQPLVTHLLGESENAEGTA